MTSQPSRLIAAQWGHPPLHPGQRFGITSSLALQGKSARAGEEEGQGNRS